MDSSKIILDNLSKSFEYTKACIEIDQIDDVDTLRDMVKSYMKLYLKQQEVLSDLFKSNPKL
jgi:hypothetical protein